MLNVGVLGYGNLGKSLVEIIKRDSELNMVAVFSRRKLDVEKYVDISKLSEYQDKIDVLALAFGSFVDAELFAPKIAGNFNTVDSFDNHSVIEDYKRLIASNNKLSIVSVGWDPGLMSIMRTLFEMYPNATTATFWGKGISQGHSNALRTVEGVKDGVQFTLPDESTLAAARTGNPVSLDAIKAHERQCYVLAEEDKHKEIEAKIKNLPNYFAPYKTTVDFVDKQTLDTLKSDMRHSGYVFSKNQCGQLNFELHTSSNPMLTAYTMVNYIKAMPKLTSDGYIGALDCLDIPLKYLVDKKHLL